MEMRLAQAFFLHPPLKIRLRLQVCVYALFLQAFSSLAIVQG